MRSILTNRPDAMRPGFEISMNSYVHHAPKIGEAVTIVDAKTQEEVATGMVTAIGANNGGCWAYTVTVERYIHAPLIQ